MRWVRLWQDMPTDPVWRTISKRSGQPIALVMAVFNFMMVTAKDEDGYITGFDDEDVATALDSEIEQITTIKESMQGKVLDGDYLTGWERRQPKREDEGSTARSRRHREAKKNKSDENQGVFDSGTQCNATQRNATQCNAPEAEVEADSDSDLTTTTPARARNQNPSNQEKPGAQKPNLPSVSEILQSSDLKNNTEFIGKTFSLSKDQIDQLVRARPDLKDRIQIVLLACDQFYQDSGKNPSFLAVTRWVKREDRPRDGPSKTQKKSPLEEWRDSRLKEFNGKKSGAFENEN